MARYIDADKARDNMKEMPLGKMLIDCVMRYVIDRLPTVDAVEVVRCKECRYKNSNGCPMYYKGYSVNGDDDYCSYGVKKE